MDQTCEVYEIADVLNLAKGPKAPKYQEKKSKIPGKKKEKMRKTPPPWHPSFLGLSPDPEVTEAESKKSYGVYHFPGKTKEKDIQGVSLNRP